MKNRPFKLLYRLLYPPACVACGQLLPVQSDDCMCPGCRAAWQRTLVYRCPVCAQYEDACLCHPPHSARCITQYLHIASYHEPVVRGIVLQMKEHRCRETFSYVAGLLLPLLRQQNYDRADVVFTSVPASRRMERTGFDPSCELARRIAKSLHAPYCKTLRRARTAPAQKETKRYERLQNAKNSYSLSRGTGDTLRGKTVILVDDVLTTGATTAVCAQLLQNAGAVEIAVLTFAKTHKYRYKRAKGLQNGKIYRH